MEPIGEVCLNTRPKTCFDFRNNIASSNDENTVPQIDTEPFNFADVVEGGVFDSHTTYRLRCNSRHRRHRSGATSLPSDVKKD